MMEVWSDMAAHHPVIIKTGDWYRHLDKKLSMFYRVDFMFVTDAGYWSLPARHRLRLPFGLSSWPKAGDAGGDTG
jgi:hypothetical protein